MKTYFVFDKDYLQEGGEIIEAESEEAAIEKIFSVLYGATPDGQHKFYHIYKEALDAMRVVEIPQELLD